MKCDQESNNTHNYKYNLSMYMRTNMAHEIMSYTSVFSNVSKHYNIT